MESEKDIIQDFNRIAGLDYPQWDHNRHYLPYLISHLPETRLTALDIGCGTGELTRLLAPRFNKVLGQDISPEMIARAQRESRSFSNIQYQLGNFLEYEFKPAQFDCIASVATVHHLPLDRFFSQVKMALKPGGVLLVLDLYKNRTLSDFIISSIAVPANILFMFIKSGKMMASAKEKMAWAQHAEHDRYSTLQEIRTAAKPALPGSIIKRHLFWRYSLVWHKPVDSMPEKECQ